MSEFISITEGTGIRFQVDPPSLKRLETADPGPGSHLWVMVGAWKITRPREEGQRVNLDAENLISLDGPGCFKCEQPFSNRLAKQPCRGSIS